MKKSITKYVSLIIAICMLCMLVACGSNNADIGGNAVVDTDSNAVVDNRGKDDVSAGYRELDLYTLFYSAKEVTPALEYECPYELSKCVESITQYYDEYATTWDIYIYITSDEIPGTLIVNDAGNEINFDGDMYICYFEYSGKNNIQHRIFLGHYLNDGQNLFVELCKAIWARGEDLSQFSVIETTRVIEPICRYHTITTAN